jgi:hypothetical protein
VVYLTVDENDKILPYDDSVQLYEEYCLHCRTSDDPIMASKTTFTDAFRAMRPLGYKLLGGKGSFKTCEICNNTNALLRTKRFTKQMREVLIKFKFKHRHQQEEERKHLTRMKEKAKTSFDEFGNPTYAFLFSGTLFSMITFTPRAFFECVLLFFSKQMV